MADDYPVVTINSKLYYEYKIVKNDTLTLIALKFGYADWRQTIYDDAANAAFRTLCEQLVADYRSQTGNTDKAPGDIIREGDTLYVALSEIVRHQTNPIQIVTRVIIASLLEIEFDTSIKVARSTTPVTTPHWVSGTNVNDSYRFPPIPLAVAPNTACSQRPAAYMINDHIVTFADELDTLGRIATHYSVSSSALQQANPAIMSRQPHPGWVYYGDNVILPDIPGRYPVQVKLDFQRITNITGNLVLRGVLNGLRIEAVFPVPGTGQQTITAQIANPPNQVSWYKGDMQWTLTPEDFPATSISLGASRVELFFLLNKPVDIFQSANGVWAEILRFLFTGAGITGNTKPDAAAAAITRFFHSGFGLEYDTASGASNFIEMAAAGLGWNLSGFKVNNYMNKLPHIVNCYDQAAALQVFCGALGIKIEFLYCNPFGYINRTDLVGVGPCNNPFGMPREIDALDPGRTDFGNHAFGGIRAFQVTNVLDSCAGPHTGNESRDQYLTAAIDHTAALYGGGSRPGAVGDIRVSGEARNLT